MDAPVNYFTDLYRVNVAEHIEKKNGFSYVSWPFAVAELRKRHPTATWEVIRFDGLPYQQTPAGTFVEVAVTVMDIRLSQIHPVLDHANRPIKDPTAFQINTSIQRCLVKAIALHGLGLFVYAGEDLPEGPPPLAQELANRLLAALAAEEAGTTEEEVHAAKSARLRAIHEDANKDSDLYREAWKLLDSKQRAAIKVFLGQTR